MRKKSHALQQFPINWALQIENPTTWPFWWGHDFFAISLSDLFLLCCHRHFSFMSNCVLLVTPSFIRRLVSCCCSIIQELAYCRLSIQAQPHPPNRCERSRILRVIEYSYVAKRHRRRWHQSRVGSTCLCASVVSITCWFTLTDNHVSVDIQWL
jgi:hypothetical protein